MNDSCVKRNFPLNSKSGTEQDSSYLQKWYLPGWIEEVFVVYRVMKGVVPTYKIHKWDDTPMDGTFYEQDLQKVLVPDDVLFRIEKVLKHQKGQVLVNWER